MTRFICRYNAKFSSCEKWEISNRLIFGEGPLSVNCQLIVLTVEMCTN